MPQMSTPTAWFSPQNPNLHRRALAMVHLIALSLSLSLSLSLYIYVCIYTSHNTYIYIYLYLYTYESLLDCLTCSDRGSCCHACRLEHPVVTATAGHLRVSVNRGALIWTPIYYDPCSRIVGNLHVGHRSCSHLVLTDPHLCALKLPLLTSRLEEPRRSKFA